jgi:glyoxylase-like metal-dependent hydrolase (beta-lactamase superfamily II)
MEVALRWYGSEQVDEAVTWIWEPHVDPFARCNIWLVRGRDADLLVDSGTGLRPLRPEIARTARPLVALATHAHFDHVGCLHEFVDRRCHVAEADALVDMPDERTLAHEFRALPEPVTALPGPDWRPAHHALMPAPPTSRLEDGDVIDLGDRSFTVLHLPGHSPGSIAQFDERSGTMFSGDALYDGELLDALPDSDQDRYMETMDRLSALSISTGHGGHGPSYDERRKRVLIQDHREARRSMGCPAAEHGRSRPVRVS